MRIVLVTVGLGVGGAERLIVDLAARLADGGDEVDVVSMMSGGELAAEVRASGATLTELGFARGRPSVRGWWHFVRHLRRRRPDVVHASMFHANLMVRVTRPFQPVACAISSAHNVTERGDARRRSTFVRVRELAYRWTDSLSEVTTQVSPVGAVDYVRRRVVSADRICFVPNGVDVEKFARARRHRASVRRRLGFADERLFVNVGAMTEQKNHLGLIDAFEAVAEPRPGIALVIVGDGPLRASIEERCAASPVSDRIEVLGQRSDVPDLLGAGDVFVLPSRFEGMPLVLIEALAAGLCPIASDVGAVPVVVPSASDGWIVPTGDPARLVAAMTEAADLPAGDLERRSAACREFAGRFAIESYVARWRQTYEAFAHEQPRRRARPGGAVARAIWDDDHDYDAP